MAVLPRHARVRRHRRVALLAAPAICLLAIGVWQAARWNERWDVGAARILEARLSDPRADAHRPLDPARGAGERQGRSDYQVLARLQRRSDTRGLVSFLLMHGDAGQARRVLDSAASDPALDNDRGVVALAEGKPAEALAALDRVLARDQRSPQALWNRALALRQLGLGHAAAELFAAVAAVGEPGWSAEARKQAEALEAVSLARKSRYLAARRELDLLVASGTPPSPTTLEGWPEEARAALHEAVRRAPDRVAVSHLEPVARALEARGGDGMLQQLLSRVASTDFARRGPLARRYSAMAAGGWQEERPGALAALARDLRAGGDAVADILLGLVMAQPRVAADPGEPEGLAQRSGDGWLALAVLDAAARLEPDTAAGGRRERLLRQGIERASAAGRAVLRVALEQTLVRLLLRQQRSIDAAPLARRTLTAARALRDWPRELQALSQLVDIAAYQQDVVSARAYTRELELADGACGRGTQAALERLAEQLIFEGLPDEARQTIRARLACPIDHFLELPALAALSELARREPAGAEAEAFRRELARYRRWLAARGPTASPLDGLFATVLEGRALIDSDRGRGRRLLEEVIARIEAMPGGGRELATPRLQAYRRLTSDAMKAGDAPRALSLIVRESGLTLPPGCVLAISQDSRKATVVARNGERTVGQGGHPARADAPETVVPPAVLEALAGCTEVSVVALSPFRGRALILPAGMGWRHLAPGDRRPPAPWRPVHHVVVSDIVTPPELGLPALAPWVAPAGVQIDEPLRGPDANPSTVLAALQRADLIEFHVHGVADFDRSDAPHLVLSPDADGNARLSAEAIRSVHLPLHPLVVLAACDSSRNSPYHPSYSGKLGLPAVFLDAGARAVLAADRPLPDGPASAFIAQALEGIERGSSGAVALRDARLAWRQRGEGSWVDQVVIFE